MRKFILAALLILATEPLIAATPTVTPTITPTPCTLVCYVCKKPVICKDIVFDGVEMITAKHFYICITCFNVSSKTPYYGSAVNAMVDGTAKPIKMPTFRYWAIYERFRK